MRLRSGVSSSVAVGSLDTSACSQRCSGKHPRVFYLLVGRKPSARSNVPSCETGTFEGTKASPHTACFDARLV